MLGLPKDETWLVDYDPGWPRLFGEEKARLQAALSALALGIEHYGSTAVPGLRAKPILDILVGVAVLEHWARCRPLLEELGYDYAPNAGVPGHHVFGRGRDATERTHLLHIVEYQGDSWTENLLFRDALRTDPHLRAEYSAVKEAAQHSALSRAAYTAQKGPFIRRIKDRLRPR